MHYEEYFPRRNVFLCGDPQSDEHTLGEEVMDPDVFFVFWMIRRGMGNVSPNMPTWAGHEPPPKLTPRDPKQRSKKLHPLRLRPPLDGVKRWRRWKISLKGVKAPQKVRIKKDEISKRTGIVEENPSNYEQ